MKKIIWLIVCLIIMSMLLFVLFTQADNSKLDKKEALEIGEEKYLNYLWMVDGAFNSEIFNGDFIVNGKMLTDKSKKFICQYQNKKDSSCIGINFEEEFKKVFASNITYEQVYGDGTFYTWFKYEKDKYVFTNLDNCSKTRMSLDQTIRLVDMSDNKLTFYVSFKDEGYQKNKTRIFALIREKDDWKVSEAYYHDICEMDYNIG